MIFFSLAYNCLYHFVLFCSFQITLNKIYHNIWEAYFLCLNSTLVLSLLFIKEEQSSIYLWVYINYVNGKMHFQLISIFLFSTSTNRQCLLKQSSYAWSMGNSIKEKNQNSFQFKIFFFLIQNNKKKYFVTWHIFCKMIFLQFRGIQLELNFILQQE